MIGAEHKEAELGRIKFNEQYTNESMIASNFAEVKCVRSSSTVKLSQLIKNINMVCMVILEDASISKG